jgi:hypothetical protein
MKWNITLLGTAILILILNVGVELALPPTQAESISEEIAPRLHVDEDLLRAELERALSNGEERRLTIRGGPLLLLVGLLAWRCLVERPKKG